MMDRAQLLVQYGFIKKDKLDNYSFDQEKSLWKRKDGKDLKGSDADQEVLETLQEQYEETGYPTPAKTLKLVWQVDSMTLEEPYYWVLDFLKEGFGSVEKLEDSFAAAENSAFFGSSQQRLGAQQDRVSSFLAQSGKMIKELFQMVRELRIIDERLQYYDGVEEQIAKPIRERKKTDDISLKGIFVDLVQGGGKSAASVYGMAQNLDFVTLPDLFFDSPPMKNKGEIERYVEGLAKDFNNNVLRVLIRHLNNYLVWRKATHKEHANRKRFALTYLHQHFGIIKMYITWLKPYLRNVEKLSLKEPSMKSADLVASFEGTLLDVEILSKKQTKSIEVGDEKINGYDCILVTFNYRTRAELKIQNEYQRGPVHIGKVEITFRAYRWTEEQVDSFRKFKEKESMELIGDVSSTVQASMDALGGELDKYLEEAENLRGELPKKKEEGEEKQKLEKSFAERFFGDFYIPRNRGAPTGSKEEMEKKKARSAAIKKIVEGAPNDAIFFTGLTFATFKKAHRMLAW